MMLITHLSFAQIVAVVIKYADNLLKGFATSLSILLSCFVSARLFNDVTFNATFVVGCLIVIASVFGYGYPMPTSSSSNSGMKKFVEKNE